MRYLSYVLVAGGVAAIAAGLYFDRSTGGTSGAVLASADNSTPTAVARVLTATATVPPVAPPASTLDATPTVTPEVTVEAAAASVPAQPVQQRVEVPTSTPQPSAPQQQQAAPSQPVATATPRPPAPTATTPPPPPPTATPKPADPPAAPVNLSGLEAQMFSAHNVERANNGVGPLVVDATLTQLARRRAQDMASKGYFSHTSPTGETAFSLLNASGYVYTLAGENLARNNYPDSQSVSTAMTGFMNSPAHRVNVLEPKFSRVGIGMAIGADGLKYFAVIFAAK